MESAKNPKKRAAKRATGKREEVATNELKSKRKGKIGKKKALKAAKEAEQHSLKVRLYSLPPPRSKLALRTQRRKSQDEAPFTSHTVNVATTGAIGDILTILHKLLQEIEDNASTLHVDDCKRLSAAEFKGQYGVRHHMNGPWLEDEDKIAKHHEKIKRDNMIVGVHRRQQRGSRFSVTSSRTDVMEEPDRKKLRICIGVTTVLCVIIIVVLITIFES